MRPKKVIFVDDEPNILDELRRTLRLLRNEYDLYFAASGMEALEMMTKDKFDIVFSDMRMPGMDGAQFLTAVREKYPHIFRILLTGQADEQSIMSTVGVVHHFLEKPCSPEAIKAILQRDLPNRNIEAEPRLQVRQGKSTKSNVQEAVRELAEQIKQPNSRVSLVFFSDEYDPQELGRALKEHLPGSVIGCTTAGQLSETGFQRGGISGASLASDELSVVPYLIHPLSSQAEQVAGIAEDVQERISLTDLPAFGFLLVDGLSMQEEPLISALYMSLGNVPIVGGSAGDSLKFKQTFVYYDGELLQDAAVFTLFLTTLPFHIFKHQHFLPTATKLVVTAADPGKRLVKEINGEPAAEAYAQLIGTTVEQLNSVVFSQHPLMLRIGDDYYVRSISNIEPDGSLKFYCAIDAGLVLTIGQGNMAIEALNRDLQRVKQDMGDPAIIIGCDCILRRLEMEEQGIDDSVGRLMAKSKVVGFSTYGEQFNSVHVNQTFTGIAIAG
ncbi:MAG: FIST N-terminal domain-containing protein [Desulfoprunum sp.]|nr:FIST N-terminal domain-containing protein [Desulfoprunum sp.]